MAEINNDEQIQILPVLEVSEHNSPYRTYTISVEPATKFYRYTNIAIQAFGLLSLMAWFLLLISLLGISFSVLNNLESVETIRSQAVVTDDGVIHQ